MSFPPAILLLLLLPTAPALAQARTAANTPANTSKATPTNTPATGQVELSRIEAVRSAEDRAVAVLWDRFAPVWSAKASKLVPEERVKEHLGAWLRRDFGRLRIVDRPPLEERDTTAGKAYRQTFQLRLDGAEARHVQRIGTAKVARLNRTFRRRFGAIGVLWVLLFFGCLRLDRATQGYLTGRLRLASLALAALGAFLIYP